MDVVLAFYFGYFLPEWYFNRSDGRVKGRISKWIRRLEVRPNDLVPLDSVECPLFIRHQRLVKTLSCDSVSGMKLSEQATTS